MKAILINPLDRTITAVEAPEDEDVAGMAALLDAEYFQTHILRRPLEDSPGAALYLDEEGPKKEGAAFWSFSVRPDLIYAGKGVITAVDVEGSTVDGLSLVSEIEPYVIWRDVKYVGVETTEVKPPEGFSFAISRKAVYKPGDDK